MLLKEPIHLTLKHPSLFYYVEIQDEQKNIIGTLKGKGITTVNAEGNIGGKKYKIKKRFLLPEYKIAEQESKKIVATYKTTGGFRFLKDATNTLKFQDNEEYYFDDDFWKQTISWENKNKDKIMTLNYKRVYLGLIRDGDIEMHMELNEHANVLILFSAFLLNRTSVV